MNTMNTDTYTKAILTVIAVCLLCLVLRDSPPLTSTANAANNALAADVDISLLSQELLAGSIANKIAAKVIKVNIVQIDGQDFRLGKVRLGSAALPVEVIK